MDFSTQQEISQDINKSKAHKVGGYLKVQDSLDLSYRNPKFSQVLGISATMTVKTHANRAFSTNIIEKDMLEEWTFQDKMC